MSFAVMRQRFVESCSADLIVVAAECGPNDDLITLAASSRLSATLSRDRSKQLG